MKKTTAVLSLGYWFSAYTLGLVLHPYKTVRELVRRPQFKALVVAPMVMWGVVWLVGMVGLRFGWVILWMAGLHPAPAGLIYVLAFIWWWLTWFLFIWQVMLSYLWVRFKGALKD